MFRTVFLGATLLVMSGIVLLFPTIVTINSRFSIATNQIESLQRDGTLVSSIDLATLQKRAQVVSQKLVASPGVQPTEHIALAQQLTPPGIDINRFATTDAGGLALYGTAATRGVLQSFIKALESDTHVALVQSDVSNFVKASNSPFTLTVSFK